MPRPQDRLILIALAVFIGGAAPVAAGEVASKELQMSPKPGATASSAPPLPSAKRTPPAKIDPITVDDLTFRQAGGEDQSSGYVEAITAAGDVVWRAEIFRLQIDPRLERDVQEVYFSSMTYDAEARALLITTETNERYSLNIDAQKVTKLD